MKNIKEFFLSILYPRRCPLCEDIIQGKETMICLACKKHARPLEEPRCKKCSKELSSDEREYCYDCERNKHFYTCGVAVFPYNKYLRRSVSQFKYHNKREYAVFYVEAMKHHCSRIIKNWEPDLIAPVPLHKSRRRRRGFNQSEILACGLGEKLGIPVVSNLIMRVRPTEPQKELNRKQRKLNLKNSFKINSYDVNLKSVLLIDDIYTTGTTIDTIACELLKQGAERVYFAVLCIGKEDS